MVFSWSSITCSSKGWYRLRACRTIAISSATLIDRSWAPATVRSSEWASVSTFCSTESIASKSDCSLHCCHRKLCKKCLDRCVSQKGSESIKKKSLSPVQSARVNERPRIASATKNRRENEKKHRVVFGSCFHQEKGKGFLSLAAPKMRKIENARRFNANGAHGFLHQI